MSSCPALRPPANDDRLQDLVPDRRRQAGCGLGLEAATRLSRVRVDGLDRKVEQLRLPALAQQDLEAAAETAPLIGTLDKLHRHLQ